MTLKISIITVVYNGEATIRDCIESVLRQDYCNVEYIVVDGASKDGTTGIVAEYGTRIAKVVSEPDKGLYDAMNKGIALATGDVVGMLNADDMYAHDSVLSHVAELFFRTGCEACYGDLVYVKSEATDVVTRRWISGKYREGDFLRGWMPPHPTFFVKRSSYKDYGGFRMDMGSAADYELMLRMIHKHRVHPAYLPEVLVRMRAGGVSNQSLLHRIRANRKDREAWSVNGLKPGLLTLWLKPLRKIGQFLQLNNKE